MSGFGLSWRGRWARHHVRAMWRDSSLRVLALALVCAVASSSAVQLFGDRVARAIESQSGDTLGADLILSARSPLQDQLLKSLDALPLRQAQTVHLPSVVWHGERSHLAGLKAVAQSYPLRGQLRTAAAPLQQEQPESAIPAPGEAWVDAQLWSELGLKPDAELEVGKARFRVARLLTYEPDRGSGFVDIAPRLLIRLDELPATGLLQPGSRAQYRLLLAGESAALESVKNLSLPRGSKLITPADARPEIRSALDRAGAFLALAGMTASLLGAVAVALCAHQYGQRLRSDVALLRCLGAGRRDIAQALVLSLLGMAVLAGGLGALLGWGVQFLLQDLAALLMLPALPPAQPAALAQAWLIALVLLLGFALPPMWRATATPPVAVLRGDVDSGRAARLAQLAAVIGTVALLKLQTPDWQLLGWVLLGQLFTAGLLGLLALALLQALRPLRQARLRGWRLGLGNLLRRRNLSLAQTMALGLGLLALLMLTVVRQELLNGWQNKLPANTPNQFLINIQRDEVEPLRAYLSERGLSAQRIWPMARARLVAVNDEPVTVDSFDDPDTQRWINRDFNLSWSASLGADNRLTEGEAWGDEGVGQAWLSAEEYARERLQLKLGDSLSLDFAGEVIRFEVRNFREVDWDSFQPNFFLLSPPGVLDHVAATWLTSFYLPAEKRAELRDLNQHFPSITVLDLDALMQQVRDIMQRIVGALQAVFLFTVAAGLIVLLAAMEAGRETRRREMALMRTLGAPRKEIRAVLLAEFAGLGGLSGLIAALCAQAVGWLLASQVFEIPYQLRWDVLLGSAAGGAALVCLLAWISLRGVMATPPERILRA